MYHFFVPAGPDADGIVSITGPDVNHIRNVLRMKPGDRVVVSDGAERDHYCVLLALEKDRVTARAEADAAGAELSARITLFQGLPKGDKMDLVVQKAVELGAARIVPVEMVRSVVRLDEKKKKARQARWQAVAEAAAKQCGRSRMPEVAPVTDLAGALAQCKGTRILLPYENASGMRSLREALEALRPGADTAVFIGPEGGFEPREVEAAEAAGAVTVSLGRRILRTETAGLVMLSACMLSLEMREEDER